MVKKKKKLKKNNNKKKKKTNRKIQQPEKKIKTKKQQELAEQTNLSVAFISRIERGSSHINLKRLSEFCTILNVSEGYILSGVSDKNEKYLYNEFNDILKKCSPEKQKLIYKLSQVIAEEDETYKSKK